MIAVNDGVVRKIGKSRKLGRFIVLQDVYGNRYTYAHLGKVSKRYPVPKTFDDPRAQRRVPLRASAAGGGPAQAHGARQRGHSGQSGRGS